MIALGQYWSKNKRFVGLLVDAATVTLPRLSATRSKALHRALCLHFLTPFSKSISLPRQCRERVISGARTIDRSNRVSARNPAGSRSNRVDQRCARGRGPPAVKKWVFATEEKFPRRAPTRQTNSAWSRSRRWYELISLPSRSLPSLAHSPYLPRCALRSAAADGSRDVSATIAPKLNDLYREVVYEVRRRVRYGQPYDFLVSFLSRILLASASADGQLRTVVCEHVSQPDRTNVLCVLSLFLSLRLSFSFSLRYDNRSADGDAYLLPTL